MTKEEKNRYNRFMDKYYPRLLPCCHCEYWRSAYASKGAEKGRYFTLDSTISREAMGAPCCHYSIDNNRLSDPHTGPFWEGLGNCQHFKKRTKAKKPKTLHIKYG